MTDDAPAVGARVVDRDDPDADPDEAVVVNCPPAPAAEWDADGRSVAEYPGNERYADDAPVAVVVFRKALVEAYPDYTGDEPLPLGDLAAEGVGYYAFPAPRLRVVGSLSPEPEAEPTPEPTPALAELAQRIAKSRGASFNWTVTDEGETVLHVEKLGQTYRIYPNGAVEGDGALADRLVALATDYVSVERGAATDAEAGR